MLAMTRRAGQKIVLGEDITIEVVEVRATPCAWRQPPRSVPVYREEIWTTVRAENEAAAAAARPAGPAVALAARRRSRLERGHAGQRCARRGASAARRRERAPRPALAPAAEHVRGDDTEVGRVRPPDADAHAREVGRAEALAQRLRRPFPVAWPASPPPTRAHIAEGQVDLVVDDEDPVERRAARRAPGRPRRPRLVHVGLRPQRDPWAAGAPRPSVNKAREAASGAAAPSGSRAARPPGSRRCGARSARRGCPGRR